MTPLALLCNCVSEECLSSVLVGQIFLFGGFRCVYICFWSCFDLLVYFCVFYSSSVSVSQGFLRLASLCGVFTLGIS